MGDIGIGTLIAVVGCAVGLAGWLSGRDKHAGDDGHWRGTVDTKLDDIRTSVTSTGVDIASINKELRQQGDRITIVEQSTKQAHHRIDRLDKIVNPPEDDGR